MKKVSVIKCLIFFLLLIFVYRTTAYSATIEEIKAKMVQATESKKQLEAEIAALDSQLKTIGQQTTSLKNTIASLDATINKNALSLKLTQNNISSTELEIQGLSLDIGKSTTIIDNNSDAIAELLVETSRLGDSSVIENLLTYNDLSEFWDQTETIYKVRNRLTQKVSETKDTKKNLENSKTQAEQKKEELLALKSKLVDQKAVLEVTKKEKNKLLADTKNTEANYKKQLAAKKALSEAFDKELLKFESELKMIVDSSSYPLYSKGILNWPLDSIRITQVFGDTEFSRTTNAYNGNGHNGVDFAASIGTPVKAVLDGTVVGSGDTDAVCYGASFGKWVLIQHNNGLSTLYAHLSLIKVRAGDRVFSGSVLGYSGNTGYSTGPHLHFTVYATQGVKIMSRKSTVCKGTYTMPVADLKAYLNPLLYLPNL